MTPPADDIITATLSSESLPIAVINHVTDAERKWEKKIKKNAGVLLGNKREVEQATDVAECQNTKPEAVAKPKKPQFVAGGGRSGRRVKRNPNEIPVVLKSPPASDGSIYTESTETSSVAAQRALPVGGSRTHRVGKRSSRQLVVIQPSVISGSSHSSLMDGSGSIEAVQPGLTLGGSRGRRAAEEKVDQAVFIASGSHSRRACIITATQARLEKRVSLRIAVSALAIHCLGWPLTQRCRL